MKPTLIAMAGMALLMGGCTMIPRYSRPAAPVPPAWPRTATAPESIPETEAADTPWREFFIEERLRRVIELALDNNRDLRVAALAIERAQAVHRIEASALYPGVGVRASGERTRIPATMTDNGIAMTSEQYSVHVGVLSWEVDLFGLIRSLKSAALEQYLATRYARRATQVSLVAAVAGSYLALAADAENLALARSTLESQQASLDLLRKSRDAGISSDLEVSQSEIQVETARTAAIEWTGRLAIDRSALDLLAGATVPADLLPERLDVVADARALSPGLPSDLLLHRPDIMAAEHELLAANANIGAARAAFFPRISLTSAIGTISPQLSGLFESGTRTWTFAPLATAPLWAGGLQRANLKAAKIDREIAVARYEKAIQTAFAEISDGLSLRTTLSEQREAQQTLVGALETNHRLSAARYEAGVDGYLGVLVAQLGLFRGQQTLVGVRLAEQANLITLYKALGGGV